MLLRRNILTLFLCIGPFSLTSPSYGESTAAFPKTITIEPSGSQYSGVFMPPHPIGGNWQLELGALSVTNEFTAILLELDSEGNTVYTNQVTNPGGFSRFHTNPDRSRLISTTSNYQSPSNVTFGVYSLDENTSPIFETSFLGNSNSARAFHNGNDSITVLENYSLEKYLISSFTETGQLEWSKSLTSDFFQDPDGSKNLTAFPLWNSSDSGYFFGIAKLSQENLDATGFLRSLLVTRISATGEILWSKSVASEASDGLPQIVVFPGDQAYIWMNYPINEQTSATNIIKIDSNGNEIWSKKILGAAFRPAQMLESGQLILKSDGGGSLPINTTELIVLNSLGEIEAGTSITYATQHSIDRIVTNGNLLWFVMNTFDGAQGEEGPPSFSTIGRLDDNLSNSQWFEYARQTKSGQLATDPETGNILFAAILRGGNKIDTILIDPEFSNDSFTQLLHEADVEIGPSSASIENLDWPLMNTVVEFGDNTPDTTEGSISFSGPQLSEANVRVDIAATNFIGETATIEVVNNEQVMLLLPTESGQAYQIDQKNNLTNAEWTNPEVIDGTGNVTGKIYNTIDGQLFIRVQANEE